MKYTFFKDELGTIWYRDCFSIEAESYEEAEQKAIEMIKNDEVENIDYCEPLYETWNPMFLHDNNNFSTLELSNESSKLIWENGE